ncbi:PREDICTED: uncharacterized protein CG7065-like [Nicrophorus vespilloides]|uniref:Uncharacterized protein CG7065-like n=1 Tax=Nicrophorus vespilloides TaxID=110193 RepID=A0ABM1N6S0_NICVS|nr:PREDICTED: uncharacterized protein CG7065-like [Nicrophorus vespilloides]XP_017782519.1 PREDICTED: uncharacterized protein CG7065-like [Nicrophorus vespilloides]XP_017782520.1 PREDICTED: uncharacterized protein CG7065-like [Nicrophorus vespilloides]
MEPVAPGTEDEVQVAPLGTKKVSEQERLLNVKGYLPNGKYSTVFELRYNNGNESWYCKVCKCPVMGRMFYHEGGRRHTVNMANFEAKFSWKGPTIMPQPEPVQEEVASMKIAPGEPVPPGFEGEITKVAQIQERLDTFRSGALLGLEYLLEIQDYDLEKEPSYLCLLCGKKGDPRTVIAHLVSYNHIQGYLQRHFPKTYQLLAPYHTRQYKKNYQEALNKIGDAIEAKYGRLLPHPVDQESFERKKDELHQLIFNGPHFSEKNGYTFENMVDTKELTRVTEVDHPRRNSNSIANRFSNEYRKRSPSPPIVHTHAQRLKMTDKKSRRKSLSSVSSISSSDLSDYDDSPRSRRYSSRRRSRSRSPRSRYSRRSISPLPRNNKREVNMPWNRPDYIQSRHEKIQDQSKNKVEKMEEFKRLSAIVEKDLQKELNQHQNNPEKHPQYNDEWKIFWNKRYKELQAEGKDAAKYDFKPEWIIYWNDKIVELHKIELKTKLDDLRRRFGLPVGEPVSFRIGKKGTRPVPIAAQPDQDHEVIIIEDKDDSPVRSRSPWESDSYNSRRKNSKDRDKRSLDRISNDSRRRDRSWERDRYNRSKDREYKSREKSWERDINYHREYKKEPPLLDCYKPPPVMRDVSRTPLDYKRSMPKTVSPEPEDDGEVNVVGVLRLLTALEDKLGSLGPKVVDMLASALAMEKKEANSSENLLDSDINCVLFETIKEKLKGQLHAGLVEYPQEKAFKQAITKIASLIHLASTRKAANPPKVDPVKVPGVGTVDKTAIAKQIATALVLQGKTDVSQAELEQLINAVVGMAEASKNSDKPITTASFLESFSKKTPEETVVVKEPEPEPEPTPSSSKDTMDGLSDSDLQTLLQNFKDLSSEEQQGLITYLKKLEAKEPQRVESLRKFVQLGQNDDDHKEEGRISPFSKKLIGSSHTDIDTCSFEAEQKSDNINIDSEDEYTYEDVFKAASKNVEESQLDMKRKIIEQSIKSSSAEKEKQHQEVKVDLDEARNVIANIMGSISKSSPETVPTTAPEPTVNVTTPVLKKSPICHPPPSAPQLPTSSPSVVPRHQLFQKDFVQYPNKNVHNSYGYNNYNNFGNFGSNSMPTQQPPPRGVHFNGNPRFQRGGHSNFNNNRGGGNANYNNHRW